MSAPAVEEVNPDEVEAASILARLFERLDAAEVRCEAFTLKPGSQLEGDDRATVYDPISYQVRFLFVAAFDHLGVLRRSVRDHGMPVVGAYPLVRAALESAAQVLWLTTGGTRGKRAFRALHRAWDGAQLTDVALRHLDPQRVSRLPELRTRLEGLLTGAGAGQRSLDRNHASMTDIIIEAGRMVQTRGLEPIDVWRLCSSMAHGNRSVSIAILERQPVGPDDGVGGTFVMTSSYRVLASFVGVLVDVIEAALDAQDRANAQPQTAPYPALPSDS